MAAESMVGSALQRSSIWQVWSVMIRSAAAPPQSGQLHALLDVVEHIIESDDYTLDAGINVASRHAN
jgi:hypothetical protein